MHRKKLFLRPKKNNDFSEQRVIFIYNIRSQSWGESSIKTATLRGLYRRNSSHKTFRWFSAKNSRCSSQGRHLCCLRLSQRLGNWFSRSTALYRGPTAWRCQDEGVGEQAGWIGRSRGGSISTKDCGKRTAIVDGRDIRGARKGPKSPRPRPRWTRLPYSGLQLLGIRPYILPGSVHHLRWVRSRETSSPEIVSRQRFLDGVRTDRPIVAPAT